ncbi:MAG: type II secretion system F family protein [Cyanobacteria bacterium P01_H01_bin.74]
MNTTVLLLIILVAIILFSVLAGVALFFFQRYFYPEPSAIQNRLSSLKGKQKGLDSEHQVQSGKRTNHQALYKTGHYKNEQLNQFFQTFPFYKLLTVRLQQADMTSPADNIYLKFFLFPVVCGTVLGMISGLYILLLLGFLVPAGYWFSLVGKRKKRCSQFVAMLPDTLGMMTSGLRAGHSLSAAMGIVSTEMQPPVSKEFALVVRDINLGISVREALFRLVARLDNLPDVNMLSTAICIQREAGGNLAEILENLSNTIRERFKLKGQISSLTGQARLTGYVLGCAPLILLLFLSVIMYSYVAPLFETQMGNIALVVSLLMQGIGFMVMKKIVDIRI